MLTIKLEKKTILVSIVFQGVMKYVFTSILFI